MWNKTNYLLVAIWLFILTAAELLLFPQLNLGQWRTGGLLLIMGTKALMVALVYMNLRKEGWALKVAFFAPIPVVIYFVIFLLYDAAFMWRS